MTFNVNFTIPKRSLGKSDIEFVVKKDSGILGELKISKGSLVWFPKGANIGYRMRWDRFNSIMKKYATGEERR